MSVATAGLEQYTDSLARLGCSLADFTSGEQTAITAKAVELEAEGYEADQALALAVKACAPLKSQSKAAIGGNYEWSRNSDGTYNIFDVPVFAKHVRKLGMKLVADADGAPKVEEVSINVDEKWLNRAVELNRRRYDQEQYLGPLHIRHHPPGDNVQDTTEPAGHFLLKYVKSVQFEGESTPMLFTDWLRIPEEVFKRIQAGRLPYRSIESLPPHFEEIDSIALLETDVPWFRLPLTSTGKEIQREVYAAKDGSPLRAYARSKTGEQWAALFYQAGESFEKKKDAGDDKEKPESKGDEDPKGAGKAPMGDDESLSMDAGADDAAELMADEPGESGGNIMGKILEALQALAKTNEMILAKVAGQPPAPIEPGAPALEKTADQSKAAFDAARGQALEAVVYGMQAEKALIAKVDKALADLAQYNLAPDTREKMLAQAKGSKDPDSVLAVWVETIKAHAAPMPAPSYSADAQRRGVPIPPPGERVPEELRAYFAESPERGAKALAASRGYDDALKMGVIPRTMSRAEFVKFNMTKDYSALLAK